MKRLRIGYFPYSQNLLAPGDRRRLPYWANARGHRLYLNQTENVDVIVYTSPTQRKNQVDTANGCPVILDLVDAYSIYNNRLEDFLRINLKFFFGQIPKPGISYKKLVMDLVAQSDLVITSSPEQTSLLGEFSKKALDILDFHEEIPISNSLKSIKNISGIFWEGLSATLPALSKSSALLRQMNGFGLNLHLVTDLYKPLLFGRFVKIPITSYYLPKIHSTGLKTSYYPWSTQNLISASSSCRFALVPVDTNLPMNLYKPENRVLISWRLGLPCFVSDTPSHRRIAKSVGIDFIFRKNVAGESVDDSQLSEESLMDQVIRGRNYILDYHSKEVLLSKWDDAFNRVVQV